MILLSFFGSVEFYVIMAVVAASIVVLSARPRTRGEMREYLLSSRLKAGEGGASEPKEPQIEFRCQSDGVKLVRRGLPESVTTSGAVSLAVRTDGVNVHIEERLVEGSGWDTPVEEAVFDIDFLPQGWYHVRYNSDRTGLFAAFQLHVRPGIIATRLLKE